MHAINANFQFTKSMIKKMIGSIQVHSEPIWAEFSYPQASFRSSYHEATGYHNCLLLLQYYRQLQIQLKLQN